MLKRHHSHCELSFICCTFCIDIGVVVTMLCEKPVFSTITRHIANDEFVAWAPHKFTLELLKGNRGADTIWLWDKLGCGDAVSKVAATTVQFLL